MNEYIGWWLVILSDWVFSPYWMGFEVMTEKKAGSLETGTEVKQQENQILNQTKLNPYDLESIQLRLVVNELYILSYIHIDRIEL